MAASRLSSCVALAPAAFTLQNRAYADSSFPFPLFSSSSSSSPPGSLTEQSSNAKDEPEEPKGAGFDPEALERGAKALREFNNSPNAKQGFDLMGKKEQTRLTEFAAEKAHYEAIQSQADIATEVG